MRLIRWIAAGLAVMCLATPAATQPPPGSIQVRMRNATGETMERVRITSPIEAEADRLAPGEATPYQAGRWMMGAIAFEAVIGGEHFQTRPHDPLGPRYRPGRYTYVVSFLPNAVPGQQRRLTAHLVEDR